MLWLAPGRASVDGYRILCLGSHADDIEIGCGGTLLAFLRRYPKTAVHWVVLSGDARRADEARRSAARFLEGAESPIVVTKEFRESFFPYSGDRLKEYFEELEDQVAPDIVFTHHHEDRHQDHRLVAELTWNTFRRHLVLEYEVPKYDGDLGQPNLFVPLTEAVCRDKVRHILESFESQRHRPWFDGETFMGLMRLRGVECAAPTRYAEAFHVRKACLDV